MEAYNAVVVGGGIAGISAAVAASREGARTLIIEKSIAFGGIAEDLIRLSIKHSFQDLPQKCGGNDWIWKCA